MKLSSPAFEHGEKIPAEYTCDGKNVNPELHIADVPKEAKSLALIMDDPDVPEVVRSDRMWVHWIIFNLSAATKILAKNAQPDGLPGLNTGGEMKYHGPCPPDRQHRYFFKLYALDTILNLPRGVTKAELEKAMQDHVLEKTELMGLYNRRIDK